MTEISEEQLHALLGAGSQLSPEQQVHIKAVSRATYDAQLLAYAQVQFFAPVLCGCDRRYDRDAPSPPQRGCVVHGVMQTDEHGTVLMFRPPRKW